MVSRCVSSARSVRFQSWVGTSTTSSLGRKEMSSCMPLAPELVRTGATVERSSSTVSPKRVLVTR